MVKLKIGQKNKIVELVEEMFENRIWTQPYAGARLECVFCGVWYDYDNHGTEKHDDMDCPVVDYHRVIGRSYEN